MMRVLPMNGSSIKSYRQKLGLTQWDLAEQLGVDQGRVSRWERGVERPRPATAAKLRDMILFEDEIDTIKRQERIVQHSLRPAVLMDKKARLLLPNEFCAKMYRERHELDIDEYVGTDFERFSSVTARHENWECFRKSGILDGDLLLLRIYVNSYGAGYVTQYEPVFEAGKVARISGEIIDTHEADDLSCYLLERIEAVYLDAPEELVTTYLRSAPDQRKRA